MNFSSQFSPYSVPMRNIWLIWKTKIYYGFMKISEFTVTKLFCLFPARLRYEEYFYKVEEREREREREGRERGKEIHVRARIIISCVCNKQLIGTQCPLWTMRCAAPAYLSYATCNSLTIFVYNSKPKLRIEFWQRENCLRIILEIHHFKDKHLFWNTLYIYVGYQNPDKSNNFFNKIFNEKLNIKKNPFIWHLGDSCKAQLFDISPINLNDGFYSRSEAFARTL